MNIEQLRQKTGEAISQADKDAKPKIRALMSLAEEIEKARREAFGRMEAAQLAARQAQGDVETAESNLRRVESDLRAWIGE